MQVSNLRLEIGGFPRNDYRIHEGDLEFRIFTPSGQSYHDKRSTWRRLTPNEIALHFRLNTIVGQWFQDKVTGWQRRMAAQFSKKGVNPFECRFIGI